MRYHLLRFNKMISLKVCAPFAGMIVVQLAYAGSTILCKIALQQGLSFLVLTVYRHLIALLFLGPLAYVLERKQMPPLSFTIIVKIFFLALFGTTINQNLYYAGLDYTSPTVATALGNVIPALTFILAVFLSMERVSIRSAKGRAKLLGTLLCICGALIFTLWKGCLLGTMVSRPLIQIHGKALRNEAGTHAKEDWIKGSVLILISHVAFSAWLLLQEVVFRDYPARLSINVLICLFASFQSSLLALIFKRNASSWRVRWNIQLATIIYCGTVISALVYYLQTFCIGERGPVFAAMFNPLLTVIVGTLSGIILAEQFYLGSLIGGLLIIVGLYSVLWGKSGGSNRRETTEHKCANLTSPIVLQTAFQLT